MLLERYGEGNDIIMAPCPRTYRGPCATHECFPSEDDLLLLCSFINPSPTNCFIFSYFVNFIQQMLRALEYLHSHNLVHRDLKSANVMLTVEGKIKLSMFTSPK